MRRCVYLSQDLRKKIIELYENPKQTKTVEFVVL